MTRLPHPGGDNNVWGDLLNDFLEVEHNSDGSLKNVARPSDLDAKLSKSGGTMTGSLTLHADPTANLHAATKQYVDTTVSTSSPSVPDATTTTKGIVQLAGDLGGTAATPTVPGLSGKTDKSTLTTKGDIYVASGSATPTRQGVGGDGQIIVADSTQSTGLKWADPDTIGNALLKQNNLSDVADTYTSRTNLLAAESTVAGGLPSFDDRIHGDLHYNQTDSSLYVLTGDRGVSIEDNFHRADTVSGLGSFVGGDSNTYTWSSNMKISGNTAVIPSGNTGTGNITVANSNNVAVTASTTFSFIEGSPLVYVKGNNGYQTHLYVISGGGSGPGAFGIEILRNGVTVASTGGTTIAFSEAATPFTMFITFDPSGLITGGVSGSSLTTGAFSLEYMDPSPISAAGPIDHGFLTWFSPVADFQLLVGGTEAWTQVADSPGGSVSSVTAGDSTITVGGTGTAPTVAVNSIPESKVTNLTTDLAAKAPITENINTVANSGTSQTLPDVTTATVHYITLTGNCTLTFPTAVAGKSLTLVLLQDATGSRTVTWPGTVKWSGGTAPTLTTTANKTDVFSFMCVDGTNWLGFNAGQSF
ncbi:MAG TPA: hypothetical protein VG992_01920 [Candidatus Saccharimonadales bacterium]|nr:hypothetical protein [Candidatus Saccharimonadales bacterium]